MLGLVTCILVTVIFVLLHEYEHAREMLKRGLRVREWGFGVPITSWPRLRLSIPWLLPNTPFYLNILPFMAYVKNSTRDSLKIQRWLPYSESSVIYGAGVWGSIFYPLVVLAVCELTMADYRIAGACAVMALVLLPLKKQFCRYGVPLLGLCLLALMAHASVFHPEAFKSNGGYLKLAADVYHYNLNFTKGVMMACTLSLCLGLMNTLPFLPLDGGRIIETSLEKIKAPRLLLALYRLAGMLIIFGLFVYDLITSTLQDFHWLFGK